MAREPDARFRYLVEDHGDVLLRAARLLCGDWAQAEDLLQRTLARTLIRWEPRRSSDEAAVGVRLELISTYLDELPELDRAEERRWVVPSGSLLSGLAELEPTVRATVVGRYYLYLDEQEVGDLLAVEPRRVDDVGSRTLAWLDRRSHLVGAG